MTNVPKIMLDSLGISRLHVDATCTNGNLFLHAVSEKTTLPTAQYLLSRSKVSLQTKLQEEIDQHKVRGFNVKHVDADVELECLEDSVPSMSFDVVATDDYESVVEGSIRVVKEGFRCLFKQSP